MFILNYFNNIIQFSQYIPPEDCYFVMAANPDAQLREVLKYFKIIVTRRDIFSRCQDCNSDEFVKVSKQLMDKLLKRFITHFFFLKLCIKYW